MLLNCFDNQLLWILLVIYSTANFAASKTDETNCNCNQLLSRLRKQEARSKELEDVLRRTLQTIVDPSAPTDPVLRSDPVIQSFIAKTVEKETVIEDEIIKVQLNDDETSVDNLKGILKCSMASFLDINYLDDSQKNSKKPSTLNASYRSENQSVSIRWSFPSADCQKLVSGVWLRIYESDQDSSRQPFLQIPHRCLTKQNNGRVSIVLPSSKEDGSCSFEIPTKLIDCRSYRVEVVPDYQSLIGKTHRTTIVIPPKLATISVSLDSLAVVTAGASTLNLSWEDNSGCAAQLTSISLRIFQDGNTQSPPIRQLKIPRDCLERNNNAGNIFSMELLTSNSSCSSVTWNPLDWCRKYALEMKSEYSATWSGLPSSLEFFTIKQQSSTYVFLSNHKCMHDQYFCSSENVCQSVGWICDGSIDCDGSSDEEYCEEFRTGSSCNNGFRCGRQCVPTNFVCDGKIDCSDETDESSCSATAPVWCNELKNPSGSFYSHSKISTTGTRILSTVLISVKQNHTILLTFDPHPVKIYDGPYVDSPLLLDSGTSVRCGGYIVNAGNISAPENDDFISSADCVWYIESPISDQNTLVLTNNDPNVGLYTMTIFDGWNKANEKVIYNHGTNPSANKLNIYSLSNRVRVKFDKRRADYKWSVTTISSLGCTTLVTESTGTISSPNYPSAYSGLLDCRWIIKVETGSKIRLFFAFFDTQKHRDFLFVHDGPSVYSQLILEMSGLVKTPFVVNSTSNEMVVRFTSNESNQVRPGFLAVYSSVFN